MFGPIKALSLSAAAIVAAIPLASASAQNAQRPVVVTAPAVSDLETRRVSYRDLNLASAQDVRKLERRVGYAVKKVCFIDDYYADKSLATLNHYVNCRDVAWDNARPQIAAAVAKAQAFAQAGKGAEAVASLAITVSAAPRS